MCVIFLWRGVSASNYKFVLAANRDEYFSRLAKPASFWEGNDSHVLAGQDLTEGYEGGSWLGITRSGRVCFLTNIRSDVVINAAKKGRGHLVSDFLKNETSPFDYISGIEKLKDAYRPFNLVAGLIDGDFIYTNSISHAPCTLEKGYMCMTNCSLDSPWLKASNSLSKFKHLFKEDDEAKSIHEKLFTLLSDNTKNFPDPRLEPTDANEWLSSIYVEPHTAPFDNIELFGTRTSTVITVDTNDHVVFEERTKTNAKQQQSDWLRSCYEYDIK